MRADAEGQEYPVALPPFQQTLDLLRVVVGQRVLLLMERAEELQVRGVAVTPVDGVRQPQLAHRAPKRPRRVGVLRPPGLPYRIRVRKLPAGVFPGREVAHAGVDKLRGEHRHHPRLVPSLRQRRNGAAAGQRYVVIVGLDEENGSGRQASPEERFPDTAELVDALMERLYEWALSAGAGGRAIPGQQETRRRKRTELR